MSSYSLLCTLENLHRRPENLHVYFAIVYFILVEHLLCHKIFLKMSGSWQ